MTKTTRGLERVHADVMGTMINFCKGGAKYILTFVDDYSRYVSVFMIKSKSEVTGMFKDFKTFFENQWRARLRCLRSDNGSEFVNKTTAGICQQNGIVHQRSVSYSPQQNGVAERMNRTIMENARSMLNYKDVSTEWWAEAVIAAVNLINRSTNTAHLDMTPYELEYTIKPQMDHLHVFGSQGFAHLNDVKRTKLARTSFKCMLLGYAEKVKGYRVFDLENAKIKVTRSMQLDEREVGGIYDTQVLNTEAVVHVTKDSEEIQIQHQEDRQPDLDEPMEVVEDPFADVEMDDVNSTSSVSARHLMSPDCHFEDTMQLAKFHPPP
uniref:Integrase catalytic domain-containing protein n=1 Tax=Peronospora matthiolae TaxID=2874970 RepID=A0AAV1UWU0_9STRA